MKGASEEVKGFGRQLLKSHPELKGAKLILYGSDGGFYEWNSRFDPEVGGEEY